MKKSGVSIPIKPLPIANKSNHISSSDRNYNPSTSIPIINRRKFKCKVGEHGDMKRKRRKFKPTSSKLTKEVKLNVWDTPI